MEKQNEKLVTLMQNLIEENEFELALYYAYDPVRHCLSAKGQPYVCPDESAMLIFLENSQAMEVKDGGSQAGRVWKTNKYEWQKNVQMLPSDEFTRKY